MDTCASGWRPGEEFQRRDISEDSTCSSSPRRGVELVGSCDAVLPDGPGWRRFMCSRLDFLDLCRKVMKGNEYLITRDGFYWFRVFLRQKYIYVFLTKIYSKSIKCISRIVKIIVLIHTFPAHVAVNTVHSGFMFVDKVHKVTSGTFHYTALLSVKNTVTCSSHISIWPADSDLHILPILIVESGDLRPLLPCS